MQKKPISVAYSPCPNDTFIFCKLSQLTGIQPHLHDVETLNERAFEGEYDVTKLSFHAWLLVREHYELLQVGAALGRGCGPLVIRRRDTPGALLADSVIAVPGEFTTAHLLLRLWNPELKNRVFMPFDQIMDAVESGAVDAGVIIHEGRFVYKERGFHFVEDLGNWWEIKTGLPIPLGCIAAKKSLGPERIAAFEAQLKDSIQTAIANPDSARDYIKAHAQELADHVTNEHIKTYVNEFTLDLGSEGRAAINQLEEMATSAGVLK